MKKTTLLAIALGIAFTAIPLVSSAQTVTTSGTTVVSGSGMVNPVMPVLPVCRAFTRSLSIGATGSDVTALQTYLAAQGYLTVSPTGYFGVLTRAAVGDWQAKVGVVAEGNAGSGIFGPLSRAAFERVCGGVTTNPTATFSANPQSGPAPLTVQFTSSAPQGTSVGSTVNFGDGSSGTLAFVPTCANCNALALVSHTYATSGTYTASLTSGNCACPANGICNCPMIQVLATTTVTVGSPVTTTTNIQQVDAPASVTLNSGGIAEVRNDSYYFTLEDLASNSATIQLTQVGCWNSFPSDTPPPIRCMIAPVMIPPQTFSIGQNYHSGVFNITLTAISNGEATFSIQ